jgi:hypothetical protein
MKLFKVVFCAGVIIAQFGAVQAAPSSIKSDRCSNFYDNRYKPAKRPKAFALSADGTRCGAAWGKNSQNIAKKEALGYCVPAAKKHGSGKCRIIDTK